MTSWKVWCLATCVLLAAVCDVPAEATTPRQVVERLHASLLDVLRQAEQLGYEKRIARLAPVLDDAFDLDFMARSCIGLAWKSLKPDDQTRWMRTFQELMNANYAARFNRFSGQTFETLGEEPAASETVMVRTRVIDPGHENVDLSYRLHHTARGWKIIDIYLKGTVSELALRRSEYSSALKRDGFDALVASVDRKVADLATGREDR